MKKIHIQSCPGFEEWRDQARACLAENFAPHQILWAHQEGQPDLFTQLYSPAQTAKNFQVSKVFLQMAELAVCHRNPERYALLYRLLWRLCHENRNLLRLKTDDDVLELNALAKAVGRDAYKIKAFLRFREVRDNEEEHFVAWYEPEHYSLEISLPFFQTRFKNMKWTILTPYRAAHWDRERLLLTDNPDPAQRPQEDEVEKYWLTYYSSIFNPARPKKQAMLHQMPKKYWKNMPETALIRDLLHTAEARTRKMIKEQEK